MIVRRFAHGAAFLERAQEWLLGAEVEHSLILMIAHSNLASAADPDTAPYFVTVEDGGEVVACAVRAPPHKPILTRGCPDAIRMLADHLLATFGALSEVLLPVSEVDLFRNYWEKRTGAMGRPGIHQRVFECREVQSPETSAPGGNRLATDDDLDLIARWADQTHEEQNIETVGIPRDHARSLIQSGYLHIWETDVPVSIAAGVPRSSSFATINHVYTPKAFRRRGYATSCVARLTEQLLEDGAAYCCLFTDVANPTSNSIYQKVGYRPVCDMLDVRFDPN